MVYRVDLAGGGVVGSGCLRRRFRMEHENHVQKQALKGAKIMEASFQEFQKR